MNYYNEIEPYCAAWLRNLIAAGLIPAGDVDERDIRDVRPDDLAGYTQCHFFAGIAGWPLALQRAGWEPSRPVWTGSCPCQPFSVAGDQRGFDDSRHLWPEFRRLIAERRPAVVFGEQVAGASRWLALVRGDLEALGCAVGAMPIQAASAGADHFRDRYWFVADREGGKLDDWKSPAGQGSSQQTRGSGSGDSSWGLAHDDEQCPGEGLQRGGEQCGAGSAQEDSAQPLADGDGERSQVALSQSSDAGSQRPTAAGGGLRDVEHGNFPRSLSSSHGGIYRSKESSGSWDGKPKRSGASFDGWSEAEFRAAGFTAAVASIDDCQFIECPDGKWRRLPPPRVRWLGTGIPARVAKLRAFGNSIDPRPAAAFIGAYLDVRGR